VVSATDPHGRNLGFLDPVESVLVQIIHRNGSLKTPIIFFVLASLIIYTEKFRRKVKKR
jgi:hypothetical protein